MASTAIATATKMLETLPETAQKQVVEHLREYVASLQDELQWDALFNRTQPQLIRRRRDAPNSKSLQVRLRQWILTSYEGGNPTILLGCLRVSG